MTATQDLAAISTALDEHEADVVTDEAQRDVWYRGAAAELRQRLGAAKSPDDLQTVNLRLVQLLAGAEDMNDAVTERDQLIVADLTSLVDAAIASWPKPASGIPLHTRERIAAWKARGKDKLYTDLANHRYGKITYGATLDYGTRLVASKQDDLQYLASFVRVQADLYAIDGDPKRKARIERGLHALSTIVNIEQDAAAQYVLALGWSCVNLTYAAAMVDYRSDGFEWFLRTCYRLLNRNGASNVQASCADSRLAIAVYLKDPALYANARQYFEWVVKACIYHRRYDGDKVTMLHKVVPDGSADPWTVTKPDTALTRREWGSLILPDFSARFTNGTPVPDGWTPEDDRDPSHANMLRVALRNAADTIEANGDTLKPHERDRINAALDLQATRTVAWLKSGMKTWPYPPPTEKFDTPGTWQSGWDGHARFCPTPAVREMAAKTVTIAGELHIGPDRLENA